MKLMQQMIKPVDKNSVKPRIEQYNFDKTKGGPGCRVTLEASLEIAIDIIEKHAALFHNFRFCQMSAQVTESNL